MSHLDPPAPGDPVPPDPGVPYPVPDPGVPYPVPDPLRQRAVGPPRFSQR